MKSATSTSAKLCWSPSVSNSESASVLPRTPANSYLLSWPPGVNKTYTVSRGRKILAPKARAWKKAAVEELSLQRPIPFGGPAKVTITLYPDNKRLFDPDGRLKIVLDALVAAGLIPDDNWKLCPDSRVRMGVLVDRAFVIVDLEPYSGNHQPLPEWLNGRSPF